MSYGIDPETGFEIEYITELEEEPVKSSSFINDTKLEYTEKIDKDKKKKYIYQLVNVNVLESEKYKNIYHDILKLILNNNKLSTITLKGYNKLEILNVSETNINNISFLENNINIKILKINNDYSNKKLYQEDYYSDIDSEKTIFKGQKRKRYYNEY